MIGPITAQRWMKAAHELGFEAARGLDTSHLGGPGLIDCVVVKNFGAAHGTIIVTHYETVEPIREMLLQNGYAISSMYEPAAATPDLLSDIVDVLADWTWTGPAASRPRWLPDQPEIDS